MRKNRTASVRVSPASVAPASVAPASVSRQRPSLFRLSSRRHSHNRSARARFVVALFGAAMVVTSPSASQMSGKHDSQAAAPSGNVNGSVVVTDAWARPALKDGTGGAYMTITNRSRSVVRVVSATSTIATATELHVSAVHDGMAHMEMLSDLVITPGASASLKPGGTHFMLVGLRRPLVQGDTTRLTLLLQTGEHVVVNVVVRTQ